MRSTPCGRLFLFYSQYSISPAGIQDFDAENLCGFAALQTGNSIGSRPSAVQQRESAFGFFPLYGVRHILKTQSKAIYKPSYMSSDCVFTAWQTGGNIGTVRLQCSSGNPPLASSHCMANWWEYWGPSVCSAAAGIRLWLLPTVWRPPYIKNTAESHL